MEGGALSHAQGRPYPEQQGERLRSAGPLCKARLHPVHCKLQDLIQLLPCGHRGDRLSRFPATTVQGPTRPAQHPYPLGACSPAPRSTWRPWWLRRGSCRSSSAPAAPGATAPAEGLPPERETERVTAWVQSCSLPLPVELAVGLDRMVLSRTPSPHQLTLRGKEQTKAMRRATRRLCASKHSPSCGGRTAPTSATVPAGSLCPQPHFLPLVSAPAPAPYAPQRAGRSKGNCSGAGRKPLHPGRGARRETRSGQPA